MAINLDKVKQERAKAQFAGEMIDFPEGETICYIAALPYPDDEIPYVPTKLHYGLGPKGKSMAMCLEPSMNEVMNNPHFLEQLKDLDKDLSGGCPTCEDRDAGKKVSGDPEQDGKPNGRYLYIVMPMEYRANPQQSFTPWKGYEVKGYLVGYRVWDAILDQFGSCGDITDPDGATFIRVCREGKKLSTKWTIQIDIPTAKKPVALSKEHRQAIADMVKPGAPCDPYRILASMARPRSQVQDLLKGIKADDGAYEEVSGGGKEETAPKEDTGATGFKPPPGKGAAKVPPKEAAKTEPKADPKKGKDDAEIKKLKAAHGEPPTCFQIDCDPNDPMCQACPFKGPCSSFLGVPIPPDVVEGDSSAEDTSGDNATPSEGILVEQASVGSLYTLVEGGDQMTYKGPAKGQHLFVDGAGKPAKVAPQTEVYPVEAVEEEPTAEEDAKLKELEAKLAAKQKKPGTAKK